MSINSILIFFHCGSNTGYAIESLEKIFYRMALILVKDKSKIFFGYKHMKRGFPNYLPGNSKNIIVFDPEDNRRESLECIFNYIQTNNIDVAFGFDQPVHQSAFATLRKAGIRYFISYWGAPISSINHGIKLLVKRLEVKLRRYQPDHYIFESKAMADTAINGRGIRQENVSIVNLGVDIEIYKPLSEESKYAHRVCNIPESRKIVFYSGHMQERKGVHIIIKSAVELVVKRNRKDVHFLITGNKNGEEKMFEPLYKGTDAEDYITFGGYRNDLPIIEQSCYIGTIASTGWDSFTVSSLEMAACGLPLIVSNLQGLAETIEDNKTGYLFTPGNSNELADKIEFLVDNPLKRNQLSKNARARVVAKFTSTKQVNTLVEVVRKVISTPI